MTTDETGAGRPAGEEASGRGGRAGAGHTIERSGMGVRLMRMRNRRAALFARRVLNRGIQPGGEPHPGGL